MSKLAALKEKHAGQRPADRKQPAQAEAEVIQFPAIPDSIKQLFDGKSNLVVDDDAANQDDGGQNDSAVSGEVVDLTQQSPFKDLSRRKQPTATIANFRKLLDIMEATVRFNELSRRCEISLPDFKATSENAEDIAVAMIMSEAARLELPESTVDRFLLLEADRNAYNPFRDFVLSRPWDGVSRIETLAACLKTKTPEMDEMARIAVRKMLLGVIAGNFNPNGVGDPPPVLVLAGVQGAGKTTFFRRLIPSNVDRGFLEGVTLDPSNKDSVMECTTHALVELGELDATFKKADISRLNAFITRHKDTYREPYGRRDRTRVRRSVYVATVNVIRFLVDWYGSRRYIGIEVISVDFFNDDIQQVWAEAYELWKRGERHALTRDENEKLKIHNAQFTQHDEVHDLVSEHLKWGAYVKDKFTYRTATDIAIMVGLKPDKAITNRVSASIRRLHVEYAIPDDVRIDRKGRYAVPT